MQHAGGKRGEKEINPSVRRLGLTNGELVVPLLPFGISECSQKACLRSEILSNCGFRTTSDH